MSGAHCVRVCEWNVLWMCEWCVLCVDVLCALRCVDVLCVRYVRGWVEDFV